jgi:hypothetical protein
MHALSTGSYQEKVAFSTSCYLLTTLLLCTYVSFFSSMHAYLFEEHGMTSWAEYVGG